jgi:hypothetical protein
MRQIRKGVFETNSSSTHSICIAKDVEITLPESIYFGFGEFGWEHDTLSSVSKKASYIYTGFINNNREEDFNKIIEMLKSNNIEVECEEPQYSNSSSGEYRYIVNGGYVDHGSELNDLLDDLLNDELKLLSYLFSDLSYIITGNDNSDGDVSIDVKYPHFEYYKGN